MGKRTTIVAVAALALLLAGIAFAVTRLYRPAEGEMPQQAAPAGWSVLKAIPSDAAAVAVFDGSSKAVRAIADSTGILRGIFAPENPDFMAFLQSLGRRKIAVSLHNSGSLVPLVAAEAQPGDSVLTEIAAKAGLKTLSTEGFLLASRSETFLGAGARHLEEGLSVLGTKHLQDLVKTVSGPVVLLVSHSHAPKLLQMYAGKAYQQQAGFVKNLTDWSAWSLQDLEKDHISLKGCSLPGEDAGSYFAAFQGTPAQDAEFPEVLPYWVSYAVSVPVPDASAFMAARRKAEDGRGALVRYNKALKDKSGRQLNPEEWFLSLLPKEVVRASFQGEDGISHEAILLRSSKDLKLGTETANAYRGCLATVLGQDFAIADSVSASVGNRWSIFADLPTVRLFQDKAFLDYSLKSRLADASVSLPKGYVVYASLSDAPLLLEDLLAKSLSAPLLDYVKGAGFAPAAVSLDLSDSRPSFRIQLDTRALKGTKVQVLERDTTVVIPTGLFPVTNYTTGQTNYLYQNSHLSVCLRDENGKDVWGIPFKEALCGRVQSIDYYNNKKIQFLFCAADRMYLLDRLGHWVNGFPVSLGKPVLLGPDAYDFTGAGGYTVMVLHKDNSLERYNLHGQKPEGWKGIRPQETVKNLPELVETRGKRYWAVRTSVQTLIYPFEGGSPLTVFEGGRMLKPDTPITPTSKGISAECYDGKTRDIKLN